MIMGPAEPKQLHLVCFCITSNIFPLSLERDIDTNLDVDVLLKQVDSKFQFHFSHHDNGK